MNEREETQVERNPLYLLAEDARIALEKQLKFVEHYGGGPKTIKELLAVLERKQVPFHDIKNSDWFTYESVLYRRIPLVHDLPRQKQLNAMRIYDGALCTFGCGNEQENFFVYKECVKVVTL